MAHMPSATTSSYVALQRFGLGARPGDLTAIAGDPRGAVLTEIAPIAALIADAALPDTVAALSQIRQIQAARKAAKKDAPTMPDDTSPVSDAAPAMDDMAPSGKRKPKRALPDGMDKPVNPLAPEIAARLDITLSAQVKNAERWAMFWANHFAVESDSNQLVRWTAGAYDREAIRPHVFGRFADLLYAATQHPAMLRYLNNATSIGPDSKAGNKRDKGLNENHARELMELPTIGVVVVFFLVVVLCFVLVLFVCL